jgi:hypothetical protein
MAVNIITAIIATHTFIRLISEPLRLRNITLAIKQLNFRHSGESRNRLEKLDAGSGPA